MPNGIVGEPRYQDRSNCIDHSLQSPERHIPVGGLYRSRNISSDCHRRFGPPVVFEYTATDGQQITLRLERSRLEVLFEVATKVSAAPRVLFCLRTSSEPDWFLISSPPELDKLYPLNFDENALDSVIIVGYVCCALSFFGICLFCLDGLQSVALLYELPNRFSPGSLYWRHCYPSSTIIPLSFDDGGDRDSISSTLPLNLHELPASFHGIYCHLSALFSVAY
jgi:hypothetical protein